jgi:opacity protein-like surface antigen
LVPGLRYLMCWQSAGLTYRRQGNVVATSYTIGGGTEVEWGRHLTFFGEYLYTDFGSRNLHINGVSRRVEIDGRVARIGLKLKVGHDYYVDNVLK